MIGSDPSLPMILLTGIGIYAALLVLTRLTGLRSFSKMSSFDFAITVAIGSVVAATLLAERPSLLVGAAGLAVLYGMQWIVSPLRRAAAPVEAAPARHRPPGTGAGRGARDDGRCLRPPPGRAGVRMGLRGRSGGRAPASLDRCGADGLTPLLRPSGPLPSPDGSPSESGDRGSVTPPVAPGRAVRGGAGPRGGTSSPGRPPQAPQSRQS